MSSDYVRIATAEVDRSRITGKTRHYRGDGLLPPAQRLEIVQVPPDNGYYLLYLDEDGAEMTDTWHESIDRAMDQANFEFGLVPGEWKHLDSE